MDGEDDVIAGRLEKFADQQKGGDSRGVISFMTASRLETEVVFWKAEPVDLKNFTQLPNEDWIETEFSSTRFGEKEKKMYQNLQA